MEQSIFFKKYESKKGENLDELLKLLGMKNEVSYKICLSIALNSF
jgi:hypothetical protein